jgi:hypothetical protein
MCAFMKTILIKQFIWNVLYAQLIESLKLAGRYIASGVPLYHVMHSYT